MKTKFLSSQKGYSRSLIWLFKLLAR